MSILTFGDFETNGLPKAEYTDRDGHHIPAWRPSPQSFAYIQTTENTSDIIDVGVLYFYNPAVIEHRASAEAIHGLTEQFLSQYRKDFVPNSRKLYKIFFKGNLIGHNMKGFDAKIGREFLERMEYGVDVPINSIEDTMYGTSAYFSKIFSEREARPIRNKRLKLIDLCRELKITDAFISIMHKKIFGYKSEMVWHNSSWDTVATYLCYRIAKSNDMM